MATNDVVPFGKYKGKPIEVLAQDYEYCDWLMQQEWVRERYGNVYTLIVNNFGEATETPEHNRLQYKFMQEENVLKLIKIIEKTEIEILSIEPEVKGWDVYVRYRFIDEDGDWTQDSMAIELKPCIGDDFPSVLRQMKANMQRCNSRSCRGLVYVDTGFLVYEQYSGSGISEEEMQDFFEKGGFIAVKGE